MPLSNREAGITHPNKSLKNLFILIIYKSFIAE